ncbi:hypothetical protein NS381_15060 [Pantoea stewartii]|nr:hypothetical protein NS381_15060 [Pantoea stewartii]
MWRIASRCQTGRQIKKQDERGLFRADVSGNRYRPDKIVNQSLSNEVKEDIRRGYTVNIKCLGLVAV